MEQNKYLGSEKHRVASSKGGRIRAIKRKKEAKERIIEYNKNPKKCLECDKPILHKIKIGKLNKTFRKKFCSHLCSAKYSNEHRVYNPKEDKRIKEISCMDCGKKIIVYFRANPKTAKCENCKKIICKPCKICGQKKCLRKDICKKHQFFKTLIKYFGFDKNKIGSIEVYEEFDRIVNLIENEYYENKLSTLDIEKKYNYPHQNVSQTLFKNLKINSRTLSQSLTNAILQGKTLNKNPNQYKCGWHTTWNNKQVFYRSSYELDYAKELDKQKIEYKMEFLRILYWDTQLLRQRVAIPDFYLPKENLIIEIKSTWTYNEQNMKDKFKFYKECGYRTQLILEHKEKVLFN